MGKYKEQKESQNDKLSCFLAKWPAEVHAMIKMHSKMKNETINQWVVRAIMEQLGRENSFISSNKI